jgi:hypothetical protein
MNLWAVLNIIDSVSKMNLLAVLNTVIEPGCLKDGAFLE